MSELTEQLGEIEGRLVDLKRALLKMPYDAPTWLRDSLNALKELQYTQYKALRALEPRSKQTTL